MPFQQVMGKFKRHKLHSGSKSGPIVKNRSQAIAIMMSEKRKGIEPSEKFHKRHGMK